MSEVKAFVLRESDKKITGAVEMLDESRLPEGDVVVDVQYSTLNYKDGLILKGLGGMVRNYPHVPGIDFAGTVRHSSHVAFKPGDPVVHTGWRAGESYFGGYATRARVKGAGLVHIPTPFTTKQAMAIGTAGFTAMIGVMALEEHGVKPDKGPVLVTGAAGGVGSIAVVLLKSMGYRVAASTGRKELHSELRDLGAADVMDRAELNSPCDRPLESERWAGCVDNVGGTTLARVLAQTMWHGSVAAVGLAGGRDLHTTVIPFLLRGVNLLGIDSNACPMDRRLAAWKRLAELLPTGKLDAMTSEAKLDDLPRLADEILAGRVKGRVVIDVRA